MNGHIRTPRIPDLERALHALAEDDCHGEAPPHVHAAVMRTWDALRPVARHGRRWRRRGATLLAIGSMTAAVAALVVLYGAPSSRGRPEPIVAPAAENPRLVPTAPRPDRDGVRPVYRPRPRPRTPAATVALGDEPRLVLVPDPIVDASAASIIRVRVPRTALVTLGIPLVEPNDGGSIDLELLVGEDGVARTIRRAMPVTVRQE